MGSSVLRLGCLWLLAASLLCLASARDGGFQLPDQLEEGLKGARNILEHEDLGCPCSHEGHHAGDCPCHLDDSWLKANKCPTCPVYGCGDCDPLKCDECKRCCEGAVLSYDRKTCSCPACDITGCLECDAEDCSKCVVCKQGYKLGVDRKCECATCGVPYCETCDPENCHKCKVCNPFLVKTENCDGCVCPECPINGCEVCNPEKCDECKTCVYGEIPTYGVCGDDKNCTKVDPKCSDCLHGVCKACYPPYELIYGVCKCAKCQVPNCAECHPDKCDVCTKCKEGFEFSEHGYDKGVCVESDCYTNVPHCAICDPEDPHGCVMCDVGFKWCDKDKVCKCEHCSVPGCKTCDKDYCDRCTICVEGYTLQDDYTCVCTDCHIDYCEVISKYDPNVCDKCIDGYAPTDDGKCDCDSCYVPNCDKCSKANCTICEKCSYGYGPSGGTDCPCEMCTVPNCKSCDTEDCKKCAVCNPGYVLVDDGYGGEPTCVCDPDQCTIDNCKTCSADDCYVCGECADGLVLDAYGNCVCECAIDGCEQCCTSDCTTCKVCTPPLVLSDDKKSCVCPKCEIDGCKKCASDCKTCAVCKEGYVMDGYGNCICPDCYVDHCAQCSAYECGSCQECEVYYSLSYDGKACDCTCEHIPGCNACDKETCTCTGCEEGLGLDECGFCSKTEESCEWKAIQSDGKNCDVVCAESTSEHTVAVASGELPGEYGKYSNNFPCFADFDEHGFRPGRNEAKGTGICIAEFGSGPAPEFKPYNRKNSTSFLCICQTQDEPLKWRRRQFKTVPGLQGAHCEVGDKECAGEGNCKDICALEEEAYAEIMLPVGILSKDGSYGEETEYNVCRVRSGGRAGYNIEAETHKGKCFGDIKFDEHYDCLCAKPCTTKTPDCGGGSGYGSGSRGGYMTV